MIFFGIAVFSSNFVVLAFFQQVFVWYKFCLVPVIKHGIFTFTFFMMNNCVIFVLTAIVQDCNIVKNIMICDCISLPILHQLQCSVYSVYNHIDILLM